MRSLSKTIAIALSVLVIATASFGVEATSPEKGGRITLRNSSDKALLVQMRGGLGVIYGDIALDPGYTGTLGCEWVWYKINAYSANDNRQMCSTGDPISVYCGETVEIRGNSQSGYSCVETLTAQTNPTAATNETSTATTALSTPSTDKGEGRDKRFDFVEVLNETRGTIKARLTLAGPIYADLALERFQSGFLPCEQVWYTVDAHEANTNNFICTTGNPTSVYCGKTVIVRKNVDGTVVCQERWVPPGDRPRS